MKGIVRIITKRPSGTQTTIELNIAYEEIDFDVLDKVEIKKVSKWVVL